MVQEHSIDLLEDEFVAQRLLELNVCDWAGPLGVGSAFPLASRKKVVGAFGEAYELAFGAAGCSSFSGVMAIPLPGLPLRMLGMLGKLAALPFIKLWEFSVAATKYTLTSRLVGMQLDYNGTKRRYGLEELHSEYQDVSFIQGFVITQLGSRNDEQRSNSKSKSKAAAGKSSPTSRNKSRERDDKDKNQNKDKKGEDEPYHDNDNDRERWRVTAAYVYPKLAHMDYIVAGDWTKSLLCMLRWAQGSFPELEAPMGRYADYRMKNAAVAGGEPVPNPHWEFGWGHKGPEPRMLRGIAGAPGAVIANGIGADGVTVGGGQQQTYQDNSPDDAEGLDEAMPTLLQHKSQKGTQAGTNCGMNANADGEGEHHFDVEDRMMVVRRKFEAHTRMVNRVGLGTVRPGSQSSMLGPFSASNRNAPHLRSRANSNAGPPSLV